MGRTLQMALDAPGWHTRRGWHDGKLILIRRWRTPNNAAVFSPPIAATKLVPLCAARQRKRRPCA